MDSEQTLEFLRETIGKYYKQNSDNTNIICITDAIIDEEIDLPRIDSMLLYNNEEENIHGMVGLNTHIENKEEFERLYTEIPVEEAYEFFNNLVDNIEDDLFGEFLDDDEFEFDCVDESDVLS